jgi:hypothetical protein
VQSASGSCTRGVSCRCWECGVSAPPSPTPPSRMRCAHSVATRARAELGRRAHDHPCFTDRPRADSRCVVSRHDQSSLHCIQYDPSLACALRQKQKIYTTTHYYRIYKYLFYKWYRVCFIYQHQHQHTPTPVEFFYSRCVPASSSLKPASRSNDRVRRMESVCFVFRVSYIPNPTPIRSGCCTTQAYSYCRHWMCLLTTTLHTHTHTITTKHTNTPSRGSKQWVICGQYIPPGQCVLRVSIIGTCESDGRICALLLYQ